MQIWTIVIRNLKKTRKKNHVSTEYFLEGGDRGFPLSGEPCSPTPWASSPASELLAVRLTASPADFINGVQVQHAISLALILIKYVGK